MGVTFFSQKKLSFPFLTRNLHPDTNQTTDMVNPIILRISECVNRDPRTEQDIRDVYTLLKLHQDGGEEADRTFFPMVDVHARLSGVNSPTATQEEVDAIRGSNEAMALVLAYYARFLSSLQLVLVDPATGQVDVGDMRECDTEHEVEIARAAQFVETITARKDLVRRIIHSLVQLGLRSHAQNFLAYILRQLVHPLVPAEGYFPSPAVCRPIVTSSRKSAPYSDRPGVGMANTLCEELKHEMANAPRDPANLISEITDIPPQGTSYHTCEKCKCPALQFVFLPKGANVATTPKDKLPSLCKVMVACGLSMATVSACRWQQEFGNLKEGGA